MIKCKHLLPFVFAIVTLPALSQKYRTPADTMRLNKELVSLNNDIASLTSKLSIAQNNLPGYHSKASNAASDAQSTAKESSDQASKATNGDLGDAKRAKKKARKAYGDAQDARSADKDVQQQDKLIAKLGRQLQEKQQKVAELLVMQANIRKMGLE